MPMKVGVYYKANYIDVNRAYIEEIFSFFDKANVECTVVDDAGKIKDLSVLIVLGGDGTILTVASECAKYGVKILGINYGRVGFLADFEPNQLDAALNMIISGQCAVEEKSMLEVEFCGEKYYALNDAVIQRSTSGNSFVNTVVLQADINGQTVDKFIADGLIISTPTGSTAYSVSAGGSILTPDLNAISLTPICAHSLHSRPIIFSDASVLTVNRVDNRGEVNLIVDGRVIGKVKEADKITIKKAGVCARFITAGGECFFKKLLYKLNMWGK